MNLEFDTVAGCPWRRSGIDGRRCDIWEYNADADHVHVIFCVESVEVLPGRFCMASVIASGAQNRPASVRNSTPSPEFLLDCDSENNGCDLIDGA